MANQSQEAQGVKRQERQVDTAVMSASRGPSSTAQSLLQQVAQQASLLPEFIRNLRGSAPQSSLREAPAEDHNRDSGESTGIKHDRELEKSPISKVDHSPNETHELDVARAVGVNEGESAAKETIGIPGHIGNFATLEGDQSYPSGVPGKDELPPSQMESQDIAGEDSIPRIQAFAKLEFDDGEFYMNTYSVELGRDIRAARLASERENDDVHLLETKRRRRSDSGLDGSQASNKARRDDGRHLASSVISESGGIVGVSAQDTDPRRRSRGEKSKSTTSSSQQLSRKSSMHIENRLTDYQSLAMASLSNLEPGMPNNSPLESLPAPDSCPLVPIHPPTDVPAAHKSISRKHVRIAFNFEKRLFEITVLGRNGAFVDEQYIPVGGVQPLKSGNTIQIGVVKVRFLLPDVAIGSTGAEAIDITNPTGDFMCFDFEDGVGERAGHEEHEIGAWNSGSNSKEDNEEDSESSESEENEDEEEVLSEASEADGPRVEDGKDQEDEEAEKGEEGEGDEEDEEDEEESEQRQNPVRQKPKPKPRGRGKGRGKGKRRGKGKTKATTTGKAKAKPTTKPQPISEPGQPVPKRKGPGRPPKNGIISKREQALLARKAREEAKAAALKEASAPAEDGKQKVPTDANQEDAAAQPRVKRKYTKRKSKDPQSGETNGVRESTEHTESIDPEQGSAVIHLKAKRTSKRPRSPSPIYDESTMTAEQLAKPSSSYVVLIHDALKASKTGALSLSQIYRAIERRYPYYKLRVQTTGWQSSVRHNLSQHDAFKKIERDGKGWMWGLVPEVSIEKEKKRKPSPPTMQTQQYYQQVPPHMMHNPYAFAGMPPPNGHVAPHMNHIPYGMQPGQMPFPPAGFLPPPLGPNGLPLPLVNAQADSSSAYQSPYQSAPPVHPPHQPPLPPPSYTNGYNGYYPANMPHPPPPPGQVSNNHPAHPTPSPSPYPPHPPNPSPAAHPSNINPSNNNINNAISTDVLQAVSKFKDALINSMDDKSRSEALVSSAINRTLYPQSSSVTAENEDPQEKAIMQALSRMLDDLSKKTHDAHRQASQPPQAGLASSVQLQQPSSLSTIVQGLPPAQSPQPQPPLSQQQGVHAYAPQTHHMGDQYPNSGTPSQIRSGALNPPAMSPQHETSAPVQQHDAESLPEKGIGVTSSETSDLSPAVSTSTVTEAGSKIVEAKRVGGKRKLEEDEAGDNNDRETKKVNSGEREGSYSSPKERRND